MNRAHVVMLVVIASVAFADQNPSLSTVLTSDGRIMEGASGSFDPTGFRMNYGPGGKPVFEDGGFSPSDTVPFAEGQDDEGNWYPLGSGLNDWVNAIAVSGSDVYVGGFFTEAGGIPANYIARWDGNSWHALGSGVNFYVNTISLCGSDVYVGGAFTQAGGISANYIARWDGSAWHALGSGVNTRVLSIAVSGSDVYVGGHFGEAGGVPANRIARWDGSAWHPLRGGVNGVVHAIAVCESGVYVGGQFHTVDGYPGMIAPSIARWDDESDTWSALGSGVNSWVGGISVSGSDVYAGGNFTQAGGSPVNYIARWDGSSWSALGNGVNNSVVPIDSDDSDEYVGGFFTEAGGIPASRIARWDGSSWHALESGVNGALQAIAVNGSDVYVGGCFTQAGGVSANYIARWVPYTGIETTPEVISGILHASPNPTASGIELSFQSIGLSPLTLEIYDAAGRLVREHDLGTLPAGSQAHYWDGLDGNGHALAQGVYFLRLASDELKASSRVVLLR